MFSSEQYIYDVNDVPSDWVLETYLELPYKLSGQSIKIKSIFNTADKDPSMAIYYNTGLQRYTFKCFSTGKSGSVIVIMQQMWNVNFKQAADKIITDYKNYLKEGNDASKELVIEPFSWVLSNVEVRKWNTKDSAYWGPYNIGSKILERFNVKPLKSFTLNKVLHSGDIVESYNIGPADYMYAYLKNDGTIYKIYRPKNKKGKFIMLDNSYIQGEEQLTGADTLIIQSSLKDGMSVQSLGLKVDFTAPNSENTILSPAYINQKKKEYKYIIVMLDNDKAGKEAMALYRDKYQLGVCYIPAEKDVADVVKIRLVLEATSLIVPTVHHAMNKYVEQKVKPI